MLNKLTRRLFLANAPVAVVAAPMVAEKAVEAIQKTASARGSGLLGGDLRLAGAATTAERHAKQNISRIFGHPDVKSAENEAEIVRHRNRLARRWQERNGGLDPDIRDLRSASRSTRCRMQMARDWQREIEAERAWSIVEAVKSRIANAFGLGDHFKPPSTLIRTTGTEECDPNFDPAYAREQMP